MSIAGLTIESGVTLGNGLKMGDTTAPTLMLHLDASTYSGSGVWYDSVGSMPFTMNNGPTYDSANGGSISFVPTAGQWANSTMSLPSLSNWSIEVWHYYDETNVGVDSGGLGACLVTETFTGSPNAINFSLGNNDPIVGAKYDLQAGFWDGGPWRKTQSGNRLTVGTWNQIVGTFDGSTIKLYINNNLIASTSYSGTPNSSSHGIRLMRRWDNADYWGGKLAIVKIYNGDLGPGRISTSWYANKGRFGL